MTSWVTLGLLLGYLIPVSLVITVSLICMRFLNLSQVVYELLLRKNQHKVRVQAAVFPFTFQNASIVLFKVLLL